MESTGLGLTLALLALIVLVGLAWLVAYWAWRAQFDRSAHVGLYLLFGIPGVLLSVWGMAAITKGDLGGGALPLLVGLGAVLPLITGFRRLLARVLPLDPESDVDMTGLAILLVMIGANVAPLFAPGSAVQPPAAGEVQGIGMSMLIVQGTVEVAIALLAVGYPVVRFVQDGGQRLIRTLPQALDRLGIVKPDLQTIGVGIAGAVGAFAILAVLGTVLSSLQPGVGDGVSDVVKEMTAGLLTPIGAIVLGLSAGIGEETLLRGAFQPRYGMVLTSLVFALLHGGQYGLNYLIIVLFAISMLWAWERKRFNTTSAIISHVLFDTTQVLLMIWLPQ